MSLQYWDFEQLLDKGDNAAVAVALCPVFRIRKSLIPLHGCREYQL